MNIKMILKDAHINGGVYILDEFVDDPIFINCIFENCQFLIKERNMKAAFAYCIFEDSCSFEYGAKR